MKINERNLSYFAACNAPRDKEGWLQKRGDLNKGFQRRYFVLKANMLFYLECATDRDPIGVIIVEGCTVELAELDSDSFTFQLVFQGPGSRSYILSASTQEDMESWMKAITCANYEYMKLMVTELQRQLEEITQADNSDIRESFLASQDIQGVTAETSHTDPAPTEHSNASSQNNKLGPGARFNPFDTASSDRDLFGQTGFSPALSSEGNIASNSPKLPRRPATGPHIRVRTFEEMHEQFKDKMNKLMPTKCGPSLVGRTEGASGGTNMHTDLLA